MQRDDVASTSVRPYFNVMCLLGSVGIWYQNNVVSTSFLRHVLAGLYVPLQLKQNNSYVLTSHMTPFFFFAKFKVAELMTTTIDPDAIKCYLRKYTKKENLNFQRRIKFIRLDEKQVGVARLATDLPFLRRFLSRLINLISEDTVMEFSMYPHSNVPEYRVM